MRAPGPSWLQPLQRRGEWTHLPGAIPRDIRAFARRAASGGIALTGVAGWRGPARHGRYTRGMTDHVVLLHGIWMRPFTLALLARRLCAHGFAASTFGYDSVGGAPETWQSAARNHLVKIDAPRVHLVGHSLGGLLALMLAREHGLPGGGRIACLGTPLCGSAVARALSRHRMWRWMLGRVDGLLCEGAPCWPAATAVGMVAGAMPFGIGALVPSLKRPHDGTVAVAETRDARLADHVTVRTSHSGLLLSRTVAGEVAGFLDRGAFPATDRTVTVT